MSLFQGFVTRNFKFCAADPRTAWSTIKALRQYRKDHPYCEWDSKTPTKEVHHIIPIRVRPDLAADPNNLFAFGSRKAHYLIGHCGMSWFSYVENLKETASNRQIGL
jgi:hypothetical protein